MAENSEVVRPEDVYSVGSRVSWGAVLAGAVVTLALYLVLTMLGAAMGLTIAPNVAVETLRPAALIWSVVAACLALFAGGFVATQLTAGETRAEALIHGVIVWGVVVGMLLWLAATGVQAGFNAMLGMAYSGGASAARGEVDWEAAARRAGVSQQTIDEWKKAASDPEAARELAAERSRAGAMVTWWALFGTLLSMGAAIGGAITGAGPTLRHTLWASPGGTRTETREHVQV